jgi:hypothetical protein
MEGKPRPTPSKVALGSGPVNDGGMPAEAHEWAIPKVSKADQSLTATVTSWRTFVSFVTRMEDAAAPHLVTYFCRGQEQDWPLRPSILRPATQASLTAVELIDLEDQLLNDFMERARGHLDPAFLPGGGPLLDPTGWWMLMQHYGAPTRLLDWTRSPYVAAYFAVAQTRPDTTGEDGAVWLVHGRNLLQCMAAAGLQALPDNQLAQSQLLRSADPPAGLTFMRCKRPTDRMIAQQTFFTVSTEPMTDHGDLIARAVRPAIETMADGSEVDVTVLKMRIPAALKPEFLRRLRFMNITAESLFPGIDGLGRSLTELARLTAGHSRDRGAASPHDDPGETK